MNRMDKKDFIVNRLLNETLKSRERLRRLDPDYYNSLVENDRKYCKDLGRDIRMRVKLRLAHSIK